MKALVHLAPILILLLFIPACGRKKSPPDMGLLYNRAAAYHDEHRNPVIVIPGILGSKLVDESGRMVWGAFGGGAVNPESPEGARTFALPLTGANQDFAESRDQVRAAGVLDTLKVKLMGLPVQLGAYVNILKSLGVGGFRDESLGISGSVDYGDDHFTCFQFGYDWRRDIAETAAELEQFIKVKKAFVRAEYKRRYGVDRDVKFDIVAHSMGGLVARYYLRYGSAQIKDLGPKPTPNWPGADDVEKVVLVGTPNAGSLDSLITLVEGRKFVPFLPGYGAPLTGTFPSIYQLLPRTRHGGIVDAKNPKRKIDILDPQLWTDMQWGLADPNEKDLITAIAPEGVTAWPDIRQAALDHQTKALHHARAFFKAMDVPAKPPQGLVINLVAGDSEDTAAVLAVDREAREVRVLERREGDGTVLRSSVLMDERVGSDWKPKLQSPIYFNNLLLLNADHLGMTKDATFTNNILYYLLEAPSR